MALSPEQMASLAKGGKNKGKKPPIMFPPKKKNPQAPTDIQDDGDETALEDDEMDASDEGDDEGDKGEEGEPQWAGEMEHWMQDLAEEYPELAHYVDDLTHEIEEGDHDQAMSALEDMLEYMSGEMNQPYPKLTPEEQNKAGERIKHHMDHVDDHEGGPEQAVSIALREASPGKYKQFEKSR